MSTASVRGVFSFLKNQLSLYLTDGLILKYLKMLNDVDIGNENILKVVCGASNAQDGLLTIYAPPGSIIPKNNMKLEVSKIRGVTSYGILCSEV